MKYPQKYYNFAKIAKPRVISCGLLKTTQVNTTALIIPVCLVEEQLCV